MRDVSAKIDTLRTATARAVLKVSPETIVRIRQHEIPKGDPLSVAKVAAIQSAKNTSVIIPYCHPVPLDYVGVEFELEEDTITVNTTVKAIYKTGVEMEALTAASVAALTLYDMLKMLDESMEISSVTLVSKEGGKSDYKESFANMLRSAVVVISDSVAAGKKHDRSGRIIEDRLKAEGVEVVDYRIIPDNPDEIRSVISSYVDDMKLDLVITTGGTGIGPRDNTPEALAGMFDRELPGISEAMRAYGQERTPYSMLSRSQAGIRGKSLILNLPGSSGGVRDSMDALFPSALHAFKMIWGGGHPKRDSREESSESSKSSSRQKEEAKIL